MTTTPPDTEARIRAWFDRELGDKIRLRPFEVCGALGNFGFSGRWHYLEKLVNSGLLTPMMKIDGETVAHYHREKVIAFIVKNCCES